MKKDFLLDPQITFLNHGSFGACPKPVFETYQNWQRELEQRPIEFLGRRITELMATSRQKLAAYLNASADDLIYFPHPSTALNMVIRSLALQPDDEILTTDHEYGAMDRTWRYYCEKWGAKYLQKHIPLPVGTQADFVENFLAGITPRTKVVFLSHITSPTALVFPAAEICRRAREAGILCIVDGAHAPGQIPLDLQEINADIYTGACHKWMLAPKGASFLYARREIKPKLDPLVISWGYKPEAGYGSGVQFVDHHEWQGTRDMAAFLSVPAAIDYISREEWQAARARSRDLLADVQQKCHEITGLPPICPPASAWQGQMAALPLPAHVDGAALKTQLYVEYGIEIPYTRWQNHSFLRISVQAYNTQEEINYFVDILSKLLA